MMVGVYELSDTKRIMISLPGELAQEVDGVVQRETQIEASLFDRR